MIEDKKVLLKEIFRKMIHLCSAAIPFLLKIAYWPVIIGFMVVAFASTISKRPLTDADDI